MNVGFFTKQKDGGFLGSFPTLGLQGVGIERIAKQGYGPDYAITVEGAELGAAWEKVAKGGPKYISLKVVIPGRDALFLAMFPAKEEGQHVAVYSETAKPKATAEPQDGTDTTAA